MLQVGTLELGSVMKWKPTKEVRLVLRIGNILVVVIGFQCLQTFPLQRD